MNEKRIRRLMPLVGLMPIYQAPNTSKPVKEHKTYPDLLRSLRVIGRVSSGAQLSPLRRKNGQLNCFLIFLTLMRRGFLYLVAIMDWHSRKVLAWRIVNSQEADVCVEALKEAIHWFSVLHIMNTDQGSQFTSFIRSDRLKRVGPRISMDGKGRCTDYVFIERLWRSPKYECVYLHAWETGSRAKSGITRWITYHNNHCPHSALGCTPLAVFYRWAIHKTQADSPMKKLAELVSKSVQEMGNSSHRLHSDLR